MWGIFLAFSLPEFMTFFKSFRMVFFKSTDPVRAADYIVVFIFEMASTVGFALLFFVVLPDLDTIRAAMLTNALCIVPGFLSKYVSQLK